jgi:hypothetical protein
MLTQNTFPNAEAQYMCDICSEAVTNPLCPNCLSTEIEAWLTLYPDLRKKLLPKLNLFLNQIEHKPFSSTVCIKCNNKRASLCPYCFTDKVLNELKKLHANKIVLKEFFQFFNFDFDHTGYSYEAEKLGVI